MKNALLVGCGTGKGALITDALLANGYQVTNIGSSGHPDANNIIVNWANVDIPFIHKNCQFDNSIDFVFFNQNSSSLRQENFNLAQTDNLTSWRLIKDWSSSLWLSCQLPFLLLHTVKNNLHQGSAVGWMLSGYMKYNKAGNAQHADYSSFKYFNYLQMQCFDQENEFKTFGIYPDFSADSSSKKLYNVIVEVLSCTDKHKEYYV